MKKVKQVRYQESDLLDIHSFRQTFRSRCNNAESFTDAMIDYVCGWKPEGMAQAYNVDSPFEMNRLYEAMNKLNFQFIHQLDQSKFVGDAK